MMIGWPLPTLFVAAMANAAPASADVAITTATLGEQAAQPDALTEYWSLTAVDLRSNQAVRLALSSREAVLETQLVDTIRVRLMRGMMSRRGCVKWKGVAVCVRLGSTSFMHLASGSPRR